MNEENKDSMLYNVINKFCIKMMNLLQIFAMGGRSSFIFFKSYLGVTIFIDIIGLFEAGHIKWKWSILITD